MKSAQIFLFSLFVCLCSFAQSPQAFNYQAVVRNNNGELLINQNVTFRISILKSSIVGASLYAETHSESTNALGLVKLSIGDGSVVSGDFATIDWGADKHFVKLELDENGGTNFQEMGTSELLSVPYALYADRCFKKRSHFSVSCEGSQQLAIGSTFTKVADLGTFTKELDETIVEVTYIGRLWILSMTSAGVRFELRVDDNPTTNGRARVIVKDSEAGGEGVQSVLSGFFDGLAAGNHTVNLYVQTSGIGSGTGALTDPGCFSVAQVNVEETY